MTAHNAQTPNGSPAAKPEPQNGSRVKTFNPHTLARLETYRDKYSKNLTELSRELGVSVTAVSKYLSSKPEGNVQKLEALIEDVVASAERRVTLQQDLFDFIIPDLTMSAFEMIRKRTRFGLISGPAGLGKTCACQLYCSLNPSAILVTVIRNLRANARGIVRAIMEAGASSHDIHTSFFDRVMTKLKDSNRLIIVDNAHLLTNSGLGFLFDIHDETGCPVAFVGNPEVLKRVSKNDQQFSRIRYHETFKDVEKTELKEPCQRIVRSFFPEASAELLKLSFQVATSKGHFRALDAHLSLAQEMQKPGTPDHIAFRAAHQKLVSNYDLAKD